jgi:hypothetical protein
MPVKKYFTKRVTLRKTATVGSFNIATPDSGKLEHPPGKPLEPGKAFRLPTDMLK